MDNFPLAILRGLLVQRNTNLAGATAVDRTTNEAELLRNTHFDIVHLRNIVNASALLAGEIVSRVSKWTAIESIFAIRHRCVQLHMRVDRGEECEGHSGQGSWCHHHLELQRERNVKIEQTIAEKSLGQLSDARPFVE